MIDLLQVRARALLSGLEDYTGLYELLWELKHFPDATEAEKVAAASRVLPALVSENLVEVFSSIWASGNFQAVAKDRATELIAAPAVLETTGDLRAVSGVRHDSNWRGSPSRSPG